MMGKTIVVPKSTPPRAAVPHGSSRSMWHRACPELAEGRARLFFGALRCGVLAIVAVSAAWGQAPQGIPRELARQRAQQLSNVRYHLSLELAKPFETIAGSEEIKFHLSAPTSLLLDFRDGRIAKVVVNGQEIAA